MSDNLSALARMVEDLATVHRYDQQACGRSTGQQAGQTVDSAVADLDALREHWGYDSWVVGGHSWGAALALLYALTHPERTRAVVYISGTGVTPPPERPRARGRLERLSPSEQDELSRLDGPARAGDPVAAARVAHLMWRTDFSDPGKAPDFAIEPLFAYPRSAAAGQALRRSLDERVTAGLAEEVRRLGMPVLVLHGEDDPLPVECARDLAGRLPQVHLTVVPGVGHNPWLEDAAAVRTALRHFLTHLPR
jgi:proline iminopeptidase